MCFSCSSAGACCVKGTDNCAFNVFYGDGSSGNGTMVLDTFQVGSLKADLLMGTMHEESHNFELPYADGVFGMAFEKGACHPVCIPPAMDAITNQTGLQNVFTMCVSHYGGTLVIGAADDALATKPYQYVDLKAVTADNRFIIPAMSEWKVGQRSISVPGVTTAMWTASLTAIGIGKETFMSLLDHLSQHYCQIDGLCSMESWFRPQKCAQLTDEIMHQMPNITMGLTRGVSITLTPEDYLVKYRNIHGHKLRCVAFIITDGLAEKGIGLLLGTAVMQRYAVVYDRARKRIGVAPARAGKCGPLTGTDAGLPGSKEGTQGKGPVLTADTPRAKNSTQGNNDPVQQELLKAEKCRAENTCSGCAKLADCSFGYQSGRCVPLEEAGKRPYPYCTGAFCMCLAVGGSGWWLGLLIGGLVGLALVGICVTIYRKRKRRTVYQRVEGYEEQDLETF